MRLLLDTHAILWWLTDDEKLRASERESIAHADTIAYVSAASVWEISIKTSLGRLDVDVDLRAELDRNDFQEMPILWRHGDVAGRLPRHHDDPFDRMLIAQAQTEQLVLVSYDRALHDYDVPLMPAAT